MTAFVVGAKGNLGVSLTQALLEAEVETCLVDRSEFTSWAASERCRNYFQDAGIKPKDRVYLCAGISDPSASEEHIQKVNVTIPRNILDTSSTLGFEVVTFGTTLETHKSMRNPYIDSKRALAKIVAQNKSSAIHLRLQTLYGVGQPKEHMFLGQILKALRNKAKFRMSSGMQIREYHHLTDVAGALLPIEMNEQTAGTVLEMRGEAQVRLKDLAFSLFSAFDQEGNLFFDSENSLANEIFERTPLPPDQLLEFYSRPPIEGVITYFETLLDMRRTSF